MNKQEILVRRGSWTAALFLMALNLSARTVTAEEATRDPGQSNSQPDFSAYDCSAIGSPGTGAVIHFGQIVQGTYYEWYQYHSSTDSRLSCISLLKPKAKTLDIAEAKAFIAISAAVGVATPSAQERAAQTGITSDSIAPPAALPRAYYPEKSQSGSSTPLPPPAGAQFPAQNENQNSTTTAPLPSNDKGGTIVPRADATPERQQTIGKDDRFRVTPNGYPSATIGYLLVAYPDGDRASCTATLASAYVVLTAGHCIHNNDHGGWAKEISFYPGQDQAANGQVIRPYGGKSDWKWERATLAWSKVSGPSLHPIADYSSDYAAVQFRTPFTFTNTFMPVVFNGTDGVNNAGYPNTVGGTTNNLAQWASVGAEDSTSIAALRTIHMREFLLDVSPGNSGGPFWTYYPSTGQRAFVGVVSYGDALNDQGGGPWFDGWNQSLVASWISWTPESDNQNLPASPSVSGLRVPSIFGSAQAGSQSYIRLFNPTANAGTVQLTLADVNTGEGLGVWTSPSIPPTSELQFSISSIERSASPPISPRSYYSISARPTFDGYFQNVLWNSGNGSLTNLTSCATKVTADPTVLVGVHSSLLQAGYPSYVVVHNTGLTAANVTLGIYDAGTGAKLGTYVTPTISANGQHIQTMTNIEGRASPPIRPTSAMYHYIVRAETQLDGELQHFVFNASSGVITDISYYCSMSPAPSS